MITDIPNNEFISIRAELDSYPANSKERSQAAIGYLLQYNLPEKVRIKDILYYYRVGAPQRIWKWLYLLERSVPYYGVEQRPWQQRLLYFPATYIFEVNYLLGRRFNYDGSDVKLLFSRHSGDHEVLQAGPNEKSAPDFYIWLNDSYLFVDYKFAPKGRFPDIESVYNYYAGGKHMHSAKLLLSFLEAEEKFYIVDYIKQEYYPLSFSAPINYITSDEIDAFKDPLAVLDEEEFI